MTYELAGDKPFTMSEFAAELSRQSGKSVSYVNLSPSEYQAALVKTGMPEAIAKLLADIEVSTSKGDLFDDSHQLSKLIGRPTTPLADALRKALKSAS